MKTDNLPDYPRITEAELSQLALNAESTRRFERRFAPATLIGAVIVLGGMGGSVALHHYGVLSDVEYALAMVGSFVAGFVIVLWTHHRMMRALPRSVHSGVPMEPFILPDETRPKSYLLVYIDRASGTYFRREFVEHG